MYSWALLNGTRVESAGKPLRQGDLSMGVWEWQGSCAGEICVLNMEEPHLFVKTQEKNAWYEHPSVKNRSTVDFREMDLYIYIRKDNANKFNMFHLHQNICYKESCTLHDFHPNMPHFPQTICGRFGNHHRNASDL